MFGGKWRGREVDLFKSTQLVGSPTGSPAPSLGALHSPASCGRLLLQRIRSQGVTGIQTLPREGGPVNPTGSSNPRREHRPVSPDLVWGLGSAPTACLISPFPQEPQFPPV